MAYLGHQKGDLHTLSQLVNLIIYKEEETIPKEKIKKMKFSKIEVTLK